MEKSKVAIVDDSDDAAALMVHVFELNGMTAEVFKDPMEAIAYKPNAALIDLNLRDSMMDGFQWARALRNGCGTDVQLIAFTGMMDVSQAKLSAAGFDNILYKPAGVDEVLGMIKCHAPIEQ